MRVNITRWAIAGLLLIFSHAVFAQSYVTDKVVVGVYDIASTEGTLLKVLPTGTPLEVLQTSDGFTQVRTPDGLTGWIETAYIIETKPAQLLVLELTDKHRQAESELEDARKQILDMQERIAGLQDSNNASNPAELDKLKNKNRSLRNQIGDMDQQLKKLQATLKTDTTQRANLEKEIGTLRKQLEEAKKTASKSEPKATATPVAATANIDEKVVAQLKTENAAMQQQLDAIYEALSMTTPNNTVSEESGVNIHIGWLISWMVLLLLIGLAVGWKLFDWISLKRHGGFRL